MSFIHTGLILSLAIQSAQNEPKVTFESKAATADHVLEGLSKATGLKLTADADMAHEVLVISIKNAPRQRLLDEIAKVSSGRWVGEQPALRLVPDRNLRDKQEQERVGLRTDGIKRAFERLSKSASATDYCGKLVLEQDYSLIAQLNEGERIVFALEPTVAQRPLAGFDTGLLQELIKEHNSTDPGPPNPDSRELSFGDESVPWKRISRPPTRILLGISNNGPNRGYDANLHLVDKSGEIAASLESGFNPSYDPVTVTRKPPKQEPESKRVELSESTKKVIEAMSDWTYGGKGSTPGEEAMDLLRRPDELDPLYFFPSEALIQRAHEMKLQLVADVPDDIPDGSKALSQTAKDYLQGCVDRQFLLEDEPDGWLSLRPDDPTESRRSRTDRKALRKLIDAAQVKGTASLDDIADFATSEQVATFDASWGYLRIFVPNALGLFVGDGREKNFETLRFFGFLDAGAKSLLRSGQSIPLNMLPAEAATQLGRIVYGIEPGLRLSDTGSLQLKPVQQAMSSLHASVATNALQEPTESMPRGFPAAATILLQTESLTAVRPVGIDGKPLSLSPFQSLDSTEYAIIHTVSQHPPGAILASVLGTFQVGRREDLTLVFRFLPNLLMIRTLHEESFDKDVKKVDASQLPSDFLKEVAQYEDEIVRAKLFPVSHAAGRIKP